MICGYGLKFVPNFLEGIIDNAIKKLDPSLTLTAYVTTYVQLFINVVLIPFLIDMMVLLEDFETRSDRQLAILNRNMIFMFLNSIALPLTK